MPSRGGLVRSAARGLDYSWCAGVGAGESREPASVKSTPVRLVALRDVHETGAFHLSRGASHVGRRPSDVGSKRDVEPIFDRSGATVGWLLDDTVRDLSGRAVAFISSGALFSYRPEHLGYFSDGFFRDRQGAAVAFLSRHGLGPLAPIPRVPPVPPVPQIAPIPPIPPIAPIPQIPSSVWSPVTWPSFLEGRT